MPDQLEAEYDTLSREELVKVATDLRAERDNFRHERDALRRQVRTDMRRFCEDIVPDFTPLGGNRPDCAVASGTAVALSDVASNSVKVGALAENPLPPDVFACAAGILCAPVIIDGSLDYEEAVELCERRGPARTLSLRLRFTETDYFWHTEENDYQSVFLKVELPPEVTTLPSDFMDNAPMVRSIDLRSTRLTALDCIMTSPKLSQVQLPSTVTSIGKEFLIHSTHISSIDLRHLTGLTCAGNWFMGGCYSLTEVQLPSSVTQISNNFLQECRSITSIDLRNLTRLTSLGSCFMSSCESLREVRLPPSVSEVSYSFLRACPSIVSMDLRRLTGLTSLGERFMAGCFSARQVYLPDSVSQLPQLPPKCKLNIIHSAGSATAPAGEPSSNPFTAGVPPTNPFAAGTSATSPSNPFTAGVPPTNPFAAGTSATRPSNPFSRNENH